MTAHDVRYPLALRLRVMRFRANLSQANLATLTGISAKLISFYEAGRRVPDTKRIEVLAHACGMSADELARLVPSASDEDQAKARQVRQCVPTRRVTRVATTICDIQPRRSVIDPLAPFRREVDTAVRASSSLAWFGSC
jgi:transcriptional regulator with XRE-family HTH domain